MTLGSTQNSLHWGVLISKAAKVLFTKHQFVTVTSSVTNDVHHGGEKKVHPLGVGDRTLLSATMGKAGKGTGSFGASTSAA